MTRIFATRFKSGLGGGLARRSALLGALSLGATLGPQPADAACGGIQTALCVSAFSSAETPPGVGSIPAAGFSFLGPGAFAVALYAPLSGASGVIVDVTNGGEAAATTTGAIAATAGEGVALTSAAGPVHAIVGSGGIAATGAGLHAVSGAAGNIAIEGSGAIKAGGVGILATTAGGNIYINETGAISGSTGISARTSGLGGLTILTTGAVTGTSGSGIEAFTQEGLAALVIGKGGVTGAQSGIVVGATGGGALSIALGGSVRGISGAGLVTSTVSGATRVTIDAGATVSGAGSAISATTASGAGAIVNNGTVAGGTGVGVLSSSGTGLLNLVNNGALGGAVAVRNAGGALSILNNATMSGAVTTAAGATTSLYNIGDWQNAGGSTLTSFTHAGTLSFGPADAAPATISVSGPLIFEATSHWNARLGPLGGDAFVVGGATTIRGGALSVEIAPGVYTIGSAYQLIRSTGAITGAFDHAYVTGGYFTSTFASSPGGLSLTLGYGSLAPVAVTRNEQAVAASFDTATRVAPTGQAATLMSALYSQSGAAPLATLDQFNADAPGAAINANLSAGRMFADTLALREDTLRSGAPGGNARNAVLGDGSLGVWSAAFGGGGRMASDPQTGASAQRSMTGGAAAGIDFRIAAFTAGVAAGVTESAFGAGAATGSGRGVHVGAHVGFSEGDFYASATALAARYTDSTTRQASAPAALGAETESAKYGAREIRGRVEMGWRNETAGLHVTPFAAIEAASLQTDGYAETARTGVGLMAVNVAGGKTLSTPGFIGARLDANFVLPSGVVLAAKASIALEHEFAAGRDVRESLAVLPAAAFTVSGAQPGVNAAQVKVGLEARLTQAVAIFASLEGEFSRANYSFAARGGAAVRW